MKMYSVCLASLLFMFSPHLHGSAKSLPPQDARTCSADEAIAKLPKLRTTKVYILDTSTFIDLESAEYARKKESAYVIPGILDDPNVVTPSIVHRILTVDPTEETPKAGTIDAYFLVRTDKATPWQSFDAETAKTEYNNWYERQPKACCLTGCARFFARLMCCRERV